MKKGIYLFCNQAYGSSYIETFKQHARKLTDYHCHIVFSAKGADIHSTRTITNLTKKIKKHLLKYELTKLTDLHATHIEVKNINCTTFIETIPAGSIGFVAGFNQIFHSTVIEKFSLFINFHPSVLPYYRGAIPSYWVIKNHESMTGFSAHKISEEIDLGEVLYQELVEVNPGISETELDRKIAQIGSYYFSECLSALQTGNSFRKKTVGNPYKHCIDYISAARQ